MSEPVPDFPTLLLFLKLSNEGNEVLEWLPPPDHELGERFERRLLRPRAVAAMLLPYVEKIQEYRQETRDAVQRARRLRTQLEAAKFTLKILNKCSCEYEADGDEHECAGCRAIREIGEVLESEKETPRLA